MLRKISTSAAGFLILATSTQVYAQKKYDPPVHSLTDGVQRSVDLAYLLANGDANPDYLPTLFAPLFKTPYDQTPLGKADRKTPVVAKVFDNLFYVGFASVGTWVLRTSDGLILFDALNTADEAKEVLVPGLIRLGLKPKDIKYLVVTHGHFDHIGGAKFIQDTFSPRVLMGRGDWNMVLHAKPGGPRTVPLPRRDVDVDDGYVLRLGRTEIKLLVTPGHTPATISTLIPVEENGKNHLALFWGGNGMPQTLEATAISGGLLNYSKSLARLTKIAIDQGADAMISNHPIVDNTVSNIRFSSANPKAKNSWVLGPDKLIRLMGSNIAAINAGIEMQNVTAP